MLITALTHCFLVIILVFMHTCIGEPLFLYYKTSSKPHMDSTGAKDQQQDYATVKPHVHSKLLPSTAKYEIHNLRKPVSKSRKPYQGDRIPVKAKNKTRNKPSHKTKLLSGQTSASEWQPKRADTFQSRNLEESREGTRDATQSSSEQLPQCSFVTLGAKTGPQGQYAWSYSYPLQRSDGRESNAYVRSYYMRN